MRNLKRFLESLSGFILASRLRLIPKSVKVRSQTFTHDRCAQDLSAIGAESVCDLMNGLAALTVASHHGTPFTILHGNDFTTWENDVWERTPFLLLNCL